MRHGSLLKYWSETPCGREKSGHPRNNYNIQACMDVAQTNTGLKRVLRIGLSDMIR